MKLPVAIQTAIDESEKQFQSVLDRLGLTREELTRVADKIQSKKANLPPAHAAATKGRRVIHA